MNWGTKIILGMVVFMLFIVTMVVYMFSRHGDDALVDENYYENGIRYNEEYDAKQNVLNDNATPLLRVTKEQIIINLKDSANYELKLLSPSMRQNDLLRKGTTNSENNLILIDRSDMLPGLKFLELKWISRGKHYVFKTNITL